MQLQPATSRLPGDSPVIDRECVIKFRYWELHAKLLTRIDLEACMRIAGREKLDDFVRMHADARVWIENWIADTERAKWRTPRDIKSDYASASFLANNVVIFNVKGNHYRLEVLVAYHTGVTVIRWAGTHAQYSKRTG